MSIPNSSHSRIPPQIGTARLAKLPDAQKPLSSSPLSSLKQVPNPAPSLQGKTTLGDSNNKSENPLTTMQQAKTTAAPYYKKMTFDANKKNNVEQLKSMQRDAKLANFPYTRNTDKLPKNYRPADLLAAVAAQDLGINTPNIKKDRGAVIDPKSGLTVTILANETDKTIVVSFGGTTSGKKVGEDLMKRSRPGMNFMTTLSQWGANFHAGLGIEPKSYKQAAALVKKVQSEVQSSGLYQGYSIRLVGHSKGGGEAMYASMMQDEPLPTTTFCPAHLSQGLINKIPKENLEKATEFINSYSPFGDIVSALRGKLPDTPGIGNGYHFKGMANSSPVEIHDQFLTQVEHFCDRK